MLKIFLLYTLQSNEKKNQNHSRAERVRKKERRKERHEEMRRKKHTAEKKERVQRTDVNFYVSL
jgi:hypothetical protein